MKLKDVIDIKKVVEVCDLVSVKPISNDEGELVKLILEFTPPNVDTLGGIPEISGHLKGVFKK